MSRRDDADDRHDRVFKALADPTRRRLLDRLHADNGQTLGGLCRDLAITRQGITQHLAILEAAGSVTTVWSGREKRHYLNPVPLQDIYERWIAKFERPELEALSALKKRLEQEEHPMANDHVKLVYVTYIATTPEILWHALTVPELTGQYWGHRNVSSWTKGSGWAHQRLDGSGADVVGTIVEVDRPRRLSHTWAAPAEVDDPAKRSRVTYDIESVGDVVRLTVTHEDLPASATDDANKGWAIVLSSLKSQLETGRPLSSLLT